MQRLCWQHFRRALSFIDAFVDEDAFQGSKHHTLQQFSTANFQLALQQGFGVVDIAFEHIFDGDEARSIFVDDAAVGGDAHFAIGEGVEGIEGFALDTPGERWMRISTFSAVKSWI